MSNSEQTSRLVELVPVLRQLRSTTREWRWNQRSYHELAYTEGSLMFDIRIFKAPKMGVLYAGSNLRKPFVSFKKLFSNYIYVYIFFHNYQFRECTIPWPNRMRLLQMLIWKSSLLMKLLCLAFHWETYKHMFKNLPLIWPATSLLSSSDISRLLWKWNLWQTLRQRWKLCYKFCTSLWFSFYISNYILLFHLDHSQYLFLPKFFNLKQPTCISFVLFPEGNFSALSSWS
jgi:hypothetical protein